jgi:hypothetical protein
MPKPNPMQPGHTYNRPPSKHQQTVNTGGNVNGKITSKSGPQVVNNSTQGRTLPKKQGR